MTSSSERPGSARQFPNVPPPQGARAPQNYARFIPREELAAYQPWQPGAFGSTARPRPATAQGPALTPEQWQAQVAAAGLQGVARGREEGRRLGYEEGYRDGLAALEGFKASFVEQTSARIGQLVSSLEAQLSALEPAMAQAVARTAVLLARQVLRSELQQHPQQVSQVAREAVNAIMMSARQIVVLVHPDDLAIVAQGAEEALKARGARLQADATVHRGGCRVESDAGSVDATVQTRWAQACAGIGQDLPLTDETAGGENLATPSVDAGAPL